MWCDIIDMHLFEPYKKLHKVHHKIILVFCEIRELKTADFYICGLCLVIGKLFHSTQSFHQIFELLGLF